jgi:hypothetical protein
MSYQLVKTFVLDLEWADGQKFRIAGDNLTAEFAVGDVSGDLQPELVVDVIRMVGSPPRYELTIKLRAHGSSSRLEVFDHGTG